VRKAGEKPVEFLKITMNEVFISSFQTAGSGSGDSLVQEHVSLNFAKVKVEYTPQKQDGTGGATMDAGWNVSENKKL
jgi:type VI secretion system secreted protein Hcp